MKRLLAVLAALGTAHPAGAFSVHIPANAAVVDSACRSSLERMVALEVDLRRDAPSARALLGRWDRWEVAQYGTPFGLLAETHPDSGVRAAAESCQLAQVRHRDSLFASPSALRPLRAVRATNPVDSAALASLSHAFEASGATLDAGRRERALEISGRISGIEVAFARRLRENRPRLAFAPEALRGMPTAFLEGRARDGMGRFLVGFEKPEQEAMLQKCAVESTRKAYATAMYRLGGEENLARLDSLAILRAELARVHGRSSWSEWALRGRMAGSPKDVARMLDGFRARARPMQVGEYERLRAWKRRDTGDSLAELGAWDIGYYLSRIRESCFRLDEDSVRRAFPSDAAVAWAMLVASRLYGIAFVPDDSLPRWHPDARGYEVRDAANGAALGTLYLDLHPRPGKYRHNAAFTIAPGSAASGERPVMALVANFGRDGFNSRELRSLFHEFGHVVHGLLSNGRYATNSGIETVPLDFVEAPSQMFESWSRRPEAIGLFAEACPSCAPIPPALPARMRQLDLLGRGSALASMVDLSEFDMRLHGERRESAMAIWRSLEKRSPIEPVPDCEFPGIFAHMVNGYDAGYYGYLWSVSLARDVVSRFGANAMDTAVGRRLRRAVLERGSDAPPSRLLRDFLGRAPDDRALLAELDAARMLIDSIGTECGDAP